MADNQTIRCSWCGDDPLYMAYHDREWGVAERDDLKLFEMLLLEGFQAGLAWITILRKREGFRAAFDGFDPAIIAAYDRAKIESLLQDEGIVRHRGKIEGAVQSARAALDLMAEPEGFSGFLWRFVDDKPIVNRWETLADVPAKTEQSQAMSKALKQRGFKFCGPTICYAFMQATGMVNDHVVDCFRYETCRKSA
ncbi:MAG: DNA-3-methyladenine glycosylase I [Alphaproteobacteria bacterium]|nr:DNA-3-methyladenine glycosylase I [Alphaproteobacteria bacterium]